MGKKRIIKKFEQLPDDLLALVKIEYPDGYEDNLITFQTPMGELATGLPLETEDTYYLIKMPKNAAPTEEDEDDAGTETSETQTFESLENLQIADEIPDEEE